MDSLTDKLEQVKTEHAIEALSTLVTDNDERAKAEAFFLLGRIRQNETIHQAISANLGAQSIRVLEHFFDEKGHEVLGYPNLVDFLDRSEYAPMSKRQYYDRLRLIREHGDEIYDLLTSSGISVRAQKTLGTGELSIKNDTLYVGDREVAVADTGIIKEVLNELFDEKRRLTNETARQEAKIKDLSSKVQTGTDEVNQLRRSLDAINENSTFENALMGAVQSLLTLATEVKALSLEERMDRAEADLRTIAEQYFQIRDAYGLNIGLVERSIAAPSGSEPGASGVPAGASPRGVQVATGLPDSPNSPNSLDSLNSKIDAILREDDDFGDEEEV